jgi:hypothetical protein
VARPGLTYAGSPLFWHAIVMTNCAHLSSVMARVKASETSRDRPLEDAERVALWLAAEADTGPFGPYVQLLLAYSNAMHRDLRIAPGAPGERVGRDWCPPERVIRLSPATRRMVEKMPDLAAMFHE